MQTSTNTPIAHRTFRCSSWGELRPFPRASRQRPRQDLEVLYSQRPGRRYYLRQGLRLLFLFLCRRSLNASYIQGVESSWLEILHYLLWHWISPCGDSVWLSSRLSSVWWLFVPPYNTILQISPTGCARNWARNAADRWSNQWVMSNATASTTLPFQIDLYLRFTYNEFIAGQQVLFKNFPSTDYLVFVAEERNPYATATTLQWVTGAVRIAWYMWRQDFLQLLMRP